jgi:hypothetical protein
MTLDELLGWARGEGQDSGFGHVADAIITLLGEAQPCGYPEPVIMTSASGERVIDLVGDGQVAYSPSELRAMCAMWLRAADEAEKPS